MCEMHICISSYYTFMQLNYRYRISVAKATELDTDLSTVNSSTRDSSSNLSNNFHAASGCLNDGTSSEQPKPIDMKGGSTNQKKTLGNIGKYVFMYTEMSHSSGTWHIDQSLIWVNHKTSLYFTNLNSGYPVVNQQNYEKTES